MTFEFKVSVEVERVEGLFESRDSLGAALMESLEGADPGQVEGDNGSPYEVTSWEVAEA